MRRGPASGLLELHQRGSPKGEGLSRPDPERMPGDSDAVDSGLPRPLLDDAPNAPGAEGAFLHGPPDPNRSKQRPGIEGAIGHPGTDPPHGERSQKQDRSLPLLVGLGIVNRDQAGASVVLPDVGALKRGDFRDPKHGVRHDRDQGSVAESGKRPRLDGRNEGGNDVGHLPTDPFDLTPAPLASLAPEPGQDPIRGRPHR